MSDFPAALDLFFQYYLKRPDLYIQFYHAINRYFGIFRTSVDNEFNTQIELFEKMIEYSSNWEQEYIVVLFLEVAKVFLKLYFIPIEGGRHKTFTMYQIPLEISEGVERYRKLIWGSIFSICKIDKYKHNVKKVLESYGSDMIEDISFPILQYDLPFIKSILESYFPKTELSNCILASKLLKIFKHRNIPCESLFAGYLTMEDFRLYNLLVGQYSKDLNLTEVRQLKHKRIDEFISNCDFIMFKKLIDVCDELNSLDGIEKHKITEGLSITFEIIYDKKDYYVDAVKYYIEKDTPGNMHPNSLINNIFSLLPDSEVFCLINNNEYNQKNTWLYEYYHELPTNLITDKHLKGLYIFLEDTSGMKITSTAFRDVDFLDKYSFLDKNVFIKGCEIILNKMKYSPFIVHVYFNLFFINSTAQTIIHKFTDDLDLLEEIYFIMLSIEKSHDHEGALLKELYLLKPSVLEKYIDYVINKNNYSYDYQESILCFYDLDNFLEIYNEIFELLIKEDQVLMLILSHFLEILFLPNKENDLLDKQDQLIRSIIQRYYEDKTKMDWLFSIVSKLINERRIEYIWLYLSNNMSFDDFKKIPLIDKAFNCVGNEIPIYSSQIEFLESLLPDFTGLKWIKHKNYIETIIDNLKKRIETIQIQDILRG